MEDKFMIAPECPHCGVRRITMNLVGECEANGLRVSFWQCANCGHGIVREKESLPGEPDADGTLQYKMVTTMYPSVEPEEAPAGTPEHIARFYRAATKILKGGDPDLLPSAATNARHTLELALAEIGAEGRRLVDKISDAKRRGLIVPVLETWATEIRLIGNEGTHGDDTDASDIAQAVYFAEMLLVCLYELPMTIENRKAKRSAEQ